jgi:hypothetical protein
MWHGGLSVVLLSLSVSQPVAADEKATDAEMVWAKRVATEFFEAALSASEDDLGGNPVGFLSAELAAEVNKKDSINSIAKLAWQYQGGRFHIKSSEVSPSGAEVIVTAELQPLSPEDRIKALKLKEGDKDNELKALGLALAASQLGPMREVPADIRVWLAKDGAGRWVIRYIRAKPREPSTKK